MKMNPNFLPAFLAGCGVAAALSVGAYGIHAASLKSPEVQDSPKAVASKVSTARSSCRQVRVVTTTQTEDNRTAGTLIGGALGGLAGNQFGKGSGNAAATAAGAVAGSMIGRNATKPKTVEHVHYEERC